MARMTVRVCTAPEMLLWASLSSHIFDTAFVQTLECIGLVALAQVTGLECTNSGTVVIYIVDMTSVQDDPTSETLCRMGI